MGECGTGKTNRLNGMRVMPKRMPLRTTVTIVSEAISLQHQYAKITHTQLAVRFNPTEPTENNATE